jgi:regulator of protease activity HflC (stomatin/prohibitin superfamily)
MPLFHSRSTLCDFSVKRLVELIKHFKTKNRGKKQMSNKGLTGLITAIIIVFVGVWAMFTFIERVPEGKVAVVYTPSEGATKVLPPGWHAVGLFEQTQEYPTRIQIVKDKISVTTNDGKVVSMSARYEYKVDPSKDKILSIFKELGSQNIEQIQEGYLYQRLFKSGRSVVSKYSLLDIYGTKTTEASGEITKQFADLAAPLGFIVADVTLGTPKADPQTQAAIDARVQSAQKLEQLNLEKQIAEQTAEKQRIEAAGVADAQIEKARGDAESAKVRAEGQAKANGVLAASLTPEVLKLEELKARQKHGWITIQGATPIVEADK